jgi:hypothetical protein
MGFFGTVVGMACQGPHRRFRMLSMKKDFRVDAACSISLFAGSTYDGTGRVGAALYAICDGGE